MAHNFARIVEVFRCYISHNPSLSFGELAEGKVENEDLEMLHEGLAEVFTRSLHGRSLGPKWPQEGLPGGFLEAFWTILGPLGAMKSPRTENP